MCDLCNDTEDAGEAMTYSDWLFTEDEYRHDLEKESDL